MTSTAVVNRYGSALVDVVLSPGSDVKPADAVRKSVRGMLPKNRLGRQMLKKLKVYTGPNHPHAAQRPQPLAIEHARRAS